MVAPRQILELFELFHAAAFDGRAWAAALTGLAQALGCVIGALVAEDPATQQPQGGILVRLDPAVAVTWHRQPAVGKVPTLLDERPLDDYREWQRTRQGSPLMEALVPRDRAMVVRAEVGRMVDQNAFGDDEIALFDALVPHIRRTLLIHRRLAVLETERSLSLEALGSLGQGVLLVDAACGLLHANRLAEDLLDARDGLQLTRGALVCDDARQSDLLRRLVAEAAGSGAGGSFVLQRRSGLAPFSVQVAPAGGEPGWLPTERPAALLCVTDPETVTPAPVDHLRALYGLTRAEAATALGLLEADGLADLARRMGVSLCTVRTHLQHTFEKTGTNRREDRHQPPGRARPSAARPPSGGVAGRKGPRARMNG